MPSVYFKTLGCKVNTFDSQALARQFLDKGYQLVEAPNAADVTVVNSCSVTQNADKEARYLARRFRRENPDSFVVFTGCYAQTDSAKLTTMEEIDLVVPNEVKTDLFHYVSEGLDLRKQNLPHAKLPAAVKPVKENRQTHFKSSLTLFATLPAQHRQQTRAFLKIQDGCDGFCSYCLIPYARGASRSVPSEHILSEARTLIDTGCPEIVITGIHVGDYGRDLEEFHGISYPIANVMAAMFEMISETQATCRLRISSLEPSEVSAELLAVLAQYQHLTCDHFHLPLQSGHDRILKLMRRSYNTEQYRDAVTRLRAIFPDASIGADVIPGFPSESEEEFTATLDFVRELNLSYLHVFPYSKRPNTAAARMPEHLSPQIVSERASVLRKFSQELSQNYYQQFIGKEVAIIWEEHLDDQQRRLGLTKNYLSVVASAPALPAAGDTSLGILKGFTGKNKLLAKLL